MVMQSSQISGMVGGQMAMFANQSQFSQQIGGMVGTSPMMGGGGMQNPYPNTASSIVGGAAMALPGMATGAGIAGGLMGGAAGMLDPFTGVARGFARGAGMGGAGAMSTLGGVGSAFASGGMRAGMGMLAGGLGGAAMMAAPYMAAGAAINTVAGGIYQGAQNISEVGGMAAQHFGDQSGNAGARGGQMGRGQVKQVVGVLRELMGEDVNATMGDLKKLMDQAGSQGMLSGIGDAQQFKERFGKIVKQVRAIADVMGTSLGEAGQAMSEMRQMGLWSTGDIMGTGIASKMAGSAAPQMMGAMQQGAQISHARGGTLRAGAMMGQRSFGTVQAAVQTGALSMEDIQEFTGGVGGAEGQRMMAGRLTNLMSTFSQSAAGRLSMAGLGETKEGRFTGEIDQEKLQKFQSGDIGLRELEKMGRGATSGRKGAVSFERFSEKLGQNLGSEGGIEVLTQLTQEIADTRFGGLGEDARAILMQQMTGASAREAELLGKLRDSLPQIREQQSRKQKAAIEAAFQNLEQKQNRSFAGLKDAVGRKWDEMTSGFQEFGESAATAMGQGMDDISDAITGTTRSMPIGQQERGRLLREGALTSTAEQAGIENMGQNFVSGGGGLLGGAMASAIDMVRGTNKAQALINAGVRTGGSVQLGGGITTNASAMQEAANRSYRRAQGASQKRLKGSENPEAMGKVRAALRELIADPETSAELRRLKEEDPSGYAARLTSKLRKKVPNAFKQLRDGGGMMDDLDTLAIAQEEEGFGGGAHSADFSAAAKELGMVQYGSTQEVRAAQDEAIKAMESATGGGGMAESLLAGAAAGALTGGASGGVLGAMAGAVGGAIAGGIANIMTSGDVSRGDIESVMTGEHGELMDRFLKGDISEGEMALKIEKLESGPGGEALGRVFRSLQGNEEAKKKAAAASAKFGGARKAQVGIEARRGLQAVAGKQAGAADIGLTGDAAASFEKIRGGLTAKGGVLEAADVTAAQDEMDVLAKMAKNTAIREKLEGGGALGRQVGALARVGDIGVMDPDTTAKTLEKIAKNTGYDLKKIGSKELERLLKGGVEEGEVGEVKNEMAKAIKGAMTETHEGIKNINQQMLQQLKEYTGANTRFVEAVDAALGGKESSDAWNEMKKTSGQGQGQGFIDRLKGMFD